MARLIHLNGPPGIGKSTIARAFAERHPGVLNLDIDQVVALISGWQDNFSETFEAGRLLAAAMASTHLAGGHDVIMPQLITNVRELADFEAAAAAAGADYCHILLTADIESSIERFSRRSAGDASEHDMLIAAIAEQNGGPAFIRKIYAQLAEFAGGKQLHAVIDCDLQTPEQTYCALI
jgi:predicted kinase